MFGYSRSKGDYQDYSQSTHYLYMNNIPTYVSWVVFQCSKLNCFLSYTWPFLAYGFQIPTSGENSLVHVSPCEDCWDVLFNS